MFVLFFITGITLALAAGIWLGQRWEELAIGIGDILTEAPEPPSQVTPIRRTPPFDWEAEGCLD